MYRLIFALALLLATPAAADPFAYPTTPNAPTDGLVWQQAHVDAIATALNSLPTCAALAATAGQWPPFCASLTEADLALGATQRIVGRNTAGAGAAEEVTISQVLDWLGATRGQLLYRGSSGWAALAPGTAGQCLRTGGAGADPSYGLLALGALEQVVGPSVIGVPASGVASPEAMFTSADGQVMRRSGTGIGFGALNLATAGATTGQLPVAKGGTGGADAATARTNLAVPQLVATGNGASLGTGNVTSAACVTLTPLTATGAASTDVVTWSPNGDWSGVTGYAPVTTGGLTVYLWPGTGVVNVKVCNPTTATISRGEVFINWRVIR